MDERDPVDVVARLCAAVPNERRRLPSDLDELVRVGYLRRDSDALVVVEQEQDGEQIDSSRNMGNRPHVHAATLGRLRTVSELRRDCATKSSPRLWYAKSFSRI